MSTTEKTIHRHHPGHSSMKTKSRRMMRRISKIALLKGEEPPIRMPGLAVQFPCCGNHSSDWRY